MNEIISQQAIPWVNGYWVPCQFKVSLGNRYLTSWPKKKENNIHDNDNPKIVTL